MKKLVYILFKKSCHCYNIVQFYVVEVLSKNMNCENIINFVELFVLIFSDLVMEKSEKRIFRLC